MNSLSRNTPLALIYGSAGFLGSHLTDKLLEKNIQVVGVDDLSSGVVQNLSQAVKDPRFNFLQQSAQTDLEPELPRLDYAIFILSEDNPSYSVYKRALENFLTLAKKHKSKILFISSVENYDNQAPGYVNLKMAEEFFARNATTDNLNARVLRLAAVFGPRMHFREPDPLIRLIRDYLNGDLNTPQTQSLDFSSRAIFITDAINLLIKALLSGVTAQKIFDGAALHPVKLSEARQLIRELPGVESLNFIPTQLPTWPTPNLLRTQKELAWKANTSLVDGLIPTIQYFKDHPQQVPGSKIEAKKEVIIENIQSSKPVFSLDSPSKSRKGSGEPAHPGGKKFEKIAWLVIGFLIITYAFFIPVGETVWALSQTHSHLNSAKFYLTQSDFPQATAQIKRARADANRVESRYREWKFVKKIPALSGGYQEGEKWVNNLNLLVEAAVQTIDGAANLSRGAKVVSGEGAGESLNYFQNSLLGFTQAEQKLSAVNKDLEPLNPETALPIFRDTLRSTKELLILWQQRLTSARVLSTLIPEVIGGETPKLVLFLLKDEASLKPAGGELVTLLEAEFEKGRIKNIKPQGLSDIRAANSQIFNEFAKEGDFATFSKKWELFYQRLTGKKVNSVVSLDFKALAGLLESVGPINLKNQGSEINLMAVENSRTSPDVGTDLVEQTLEGVIRNLLLVSTQDWSKLASSVDTLVSQKHLMVYSDDPKILAYLSRANWSGRIPKQTETAPGVQQDLIAILEENLSAKTPYSKINRSLSLDTKISPTHQIRHRLSVNYSYPQAESESEDYTSDVRVFLSAGTRLISAFWGQTEITGSVSSFSDYGRAGYQVRINLAPKEQKSLTLNLMNAKNFEFNDKTGELKVEFLKQAGTREGEKINYKLEYPPGYQLIKAPSQKLTQAAGEININSDFNRDLYLEFKFKQAGEE